MDRVANEPTVSLSGALIDADAMNPSPVLRLRAACRCGAKNRQGLPCQAPAIHGKRRCRLHGGKNSGGKTGKQNGQYKHGLRSREVIRGKRLFKALVRKVIAHVEEA